MSLQHNNLRNYQLCDVNNMTTIPHDLMKLDPDVSSTGVNF